MQITKRTWKAKEAVTLPNPVTVSAPKSHVRPKRNMIPAILMTNLTTVFFFISSLVRSSLCRVCLIITLIMKTKMTTLTIRMAKMGPRKAPKNTAVSLMKQLEERMRTFYSTILCN